MTLLGIIGLMMVAIGIGKRSSRLGGKQYVMILIITLLQVGIVLYHMYTMDMPPLK
jgi:hypothetical protein